MRDTNSNFFLSDKAAIQLLKGIAVFSHYEAYNSFQMDINCGKEWSYRGYSSLWGWNKGKVKRFVDALLSPEGLSRIGQLKLKKPVHVLADSNRPAVDQLQTSSRPPMSAISRDYPPRIDQLQTSNRPAIDRTIHTETETETKDKKIKAEPKNIRPEYSELFEAFWREYPNKKKKHNAYQSWKKYKCGNGLYDEIMSALKKQKNSDEWARDGGKYIPHGSTWVNGKMWQDETKQVKPMTQTEITLSRFQ